VSIIVDILRKPPLAQPIAFVRNVGRASSGSMAVAQGFVVKVLMLAMNLATGVLSARILGPTGRAEQAALMLGAGLFPAVLSFGLPVAIQYRLRTRPEQAEQLISTATFLAIAFGLLSVAAGYLILPRMLTQYSDSVVHAAQIFMVFAPLAVLLNVFTGVLQARSRFAEANVSQYGPLLLAMLALGMLAIGHSLTPVTSAATYLVTSALASCWLWFVVRPKLSFTGFKAAIRTLMSFGTRSYVTDLLGVLSIQIDTILVITLLNPRSMGLYAIALSAARLSDLFSSGIVNVVFPKSVALPRSEMLALTNRVTRLTFAVLCVTMLTNIITMPFLLPAFFGKGFAEAVGPAQILAITFLLSGTGWVMAQSFLAAGKPTVIALIQASGIVFAVPLLLVLIPRFGLIGAAWALVVSTVLRTAIAMMCFPLVLKSPIPSIIPTLTDIRFVKDSLTVRLSSGRA
jgi:enterobacterial common antigen flippase